MISLIFAIRKSHFHQIISTQFSRGLNHAVILWKFEPVVMWLVSSIFGYFDQRILTPSIRTI